MVKDNWYVKVLCKNIKGIVLHPDLNMEIADISFSSDNYCLKRH